MQSESAFTDGEVLPTTLRRSNLTIIVDEVNSTEIITVLSYAAEATIVTPAAFACNVSHAILCSACLPLTLFTCNALCTLVTLELLMP